MKSDLKSPMETIGMPSPGFPTRRTTSLRVRLMLLILLSILPVFGLLIYQSAHERDDRIRTAKEDAMRAAELVVGGASQVVEGTRDLLVSLSHSVSMPSLDTKSTSARLAILQKYTTHYTNIGIVAEDGRVVASAIPLPENTTVIATSAWYQRLQAPREFAVGDLVFGSVSQQRCVYFVVPIPGQPADRPRAALYASLNLEALQKCISRAALPDDSVVLITDRTGVHLARNPEPGKWVGKKSQVWDAFQDKSRRDGGFVREAGVDGVVRLYRFLQVPNSDGGLFVGIGVSEAAILAACNARFVDSLLLLSLCSLTAMLLASMFSELAVLRHLRQVAAAARRLAQGEFGTRIRMKGGAKEFRSLAGTFDGMAEALQYHNRDLEEQIQKRTQALRDSENTMRTLMDAIPEAALLLDAECRIIAVNQVAGRRLGRKSTEMSGITMFDLLTPDLAASRTAHFRQAMETGEPVRFEDTRAGLVFSNHVTPIRSPSGAIEGVAVLGIDITRSRMAEAEQMKLMNDLQRANGELRNALANIKKLSGLLPICAWCKSVRDDSGYWARIEAYLGKHAQASLTHSICPHCAERNFGDGGET